MLLSPIAALAGEPKQAVLDAVTNAGYPATVVQK
jgi:hypothetical protein